MNSERTVIGLFRDKAFRNFLSIVIKYKWMYIWAIVTEMAITGVSLVFAEAGRRLFDLAPNVPKDALVLILIVITFVTVLRLLFTFWNNWVKSLLNESVVYEMRRNILNHLQYLPLPFHENQHSSNSVNIMHNELEIAKNFIVSDVQRLITLPLSFVVIGIYLMTVHPILGTIAICIGPFQLLSNLVFKEKFKYAAERQNQVTRDVFFTIGETLQGIREVKANQIETVIDERMKDIQQKGVEFNVLLTKIRTIRFLAKDLPGQIGYVLGLGFGATLMISGEIGPGGLVAFITLLDKVGAPFTTLVEMINNLQHSISGARRLYDVMELPKEEQNKGLLMPQTAPVIQFRNTSFEYLAGVDTIKNITIDIPAGSSVALVGPSGAGKSTIIKLLYRFYDPQNGEILIDGVSIREYSIHSLRKSMALVSQDIFLFDGTVADNIKIGRPEASREEVEQAARLAQAGDFINALPNGFDSEIGERGIKLSHGQKQRISIARAILRKAPILVLDEPTSALDVVTEASFQRDLGEWAQHYTKIIIAHRLSTIREADYVVFIDKGEVVECGTPKQLIERNGHFRTYWEKQGLFEPSSNAV